MSAPGSGALAILELTGDGALACVERLSGAGRLRGAGPSLVTLRRPRDEGDERDGGDEVLDEALVLVHGPRQLELHLHGSPAVVAAVAQELGGLVPAPPARNLEQAAREDLLLAPCDAAARVLLDQSEGALTRALQELAGRPWEDAVAGAEALLAAGRSAAHALRPLTVVLAGPVNAGKSTLFNTLLGEERALVHGEAGTTRDAIGEVALFGQWPVQLVDTAGARALPLAGAESGAPADCDASGSSLEVEAAGQARARELAQGAGLVLWCAPASPASPASPGTPGSVAAGETKGQARAGCESGPGAGAVGEPPAGAVVLTTRAGSVTAGARRIAALEEPSETRTEVARIFREHRGLPPRAWNPGEAVPFRQEHLMALEGWLAQAREVARGGPVPKPLSELLGPH
ncbi:MAG: 50S ribosome-binding GTPase [Planctomycetota bacterium]|nr:50S ribosome-binding GTPase [Planctomycetota bacterium]